MQNICFKSRVSRYKDFDLVRRRSTLKDFLRFRTEKFFALSYVKWAYEKPLFNRQKKSVSFFRFEDERKDCGRIRIRKSCYIFVCKRTVFRLCVVPRSLLRACFRKAKRACGVAVFRGCKRRVFARLAHAFVCDCSRNFAYRVVCDFFKIRKNVPLWSVALCALVGMIPYVVCGCLLCGDYLKFGLCALFAVAGTFCFGICAYAVFVRSVLHKATVDELICGGITLAVTGYALCGVGGLGFYAYGAVLAFCLLFCSVCFKPQTTLFAGILFGVGASLAKWDMTYLAAAVALATASVAFSPFTKWSSALAIVAIEGIEWLLNAYSGAGWQSLVTCAVGVVCALCVPSSFTTKIKGLAKGDNRRAYTGVVNRRGRELASRLSSASDVFTICRKTSKNLPKNLRSVPRTNLQRTSQRIFADDAETEKFAFPHWVRTRRT